MESLSVSYLLNEWQHFPLRFQRFVLTYAECLWSQEDRDLETVTSAQKTLYHAGCFGTSRFSTAAQ